ncbi:hypothetical protein OE88DRAFT_1640219, partial [Heliocybe sulcata]
MILTDEDRDNIRAFKLRMVSKMSRESFDLMRITFSHKLSISSEWIMLHRLTLLTGIEPEWYDCCINSCICYTGKYSVLDTCHYCHEARYQGDNPRRRFCYFPLIPRFQAYFQSEKTVRTLLYRHEYEQTSKIYRDVFDGKHYEILKEKHIEIAGEKQNHKFFSGKNDLAFAMCTDGYLLY